MRYYLRERDGVPGEIWQICWTEPNGTPRRRSTRTRDRKLADVRLAEFIVRQGHMHEEAPDTVPLSAVLIRYWEKRRDHLSPQSRKLVLFMLKQVPTHLPGLTVAGFTPEQQEKLIEKMGVSGSTARRYMGIVQAALNFAHRRQEIRRVPRLMAVEGGKARGKGARPLKVEEMRAILAAAQQPQDRLFALLAITTLPRPTAIVQLTWDRVSQLVAYPIPGARETKKRRALVPLSPTVARYLEAHRSLGPVLQVNGRPLKGYRSVSDRLIAAAGITDPRVSAYSFRKGGASFLRGAGVSPWDVQGVLGHRATLGETDEYAWMDPAYMLGFRAAIESLLREISPPWLASYLPAVSPQVVQVIESNGGPCWARTSDQLLKRDVDFAVFQPLKASNDD